MNLTGLWAARRRGDSVLLVLLGLLIYSLVTIRALRNLDPTLSIPTTPTKEAS